MLFYLGRAVRGEVLANGKDNIRSRRYERTIQPEKLADDPLDPVPSDSPFHSVNTDSQSAPFVAVRCMDDGEPVPPDPSAAFIDLPILPGLSE